MSAEIKARRRLHSVRLHLEPKQPVQRLQAAPRHLQSERAFVRREWFFTAEAS